MTPKIQRRMQFPQDALFKFGLREKTDCLTNIRTFFSHDWNANHWLMSYIANSSISLKAQKSIPYC